VVTRDRLVRKAITQSAKLRRPTTPHGGGFASCQKRGTSRAGRADSCIVRLFQSNNLRRSHAESERFSGLNNVLFSARRFPQSVLQQGNLYGLPTSARGSFSGRFVIEPGRVMLAGSRVLWSLPLAREAIPWESEFIFEVNTSVWPGCNPQHFRRESRFVVNEWCSDGVCRENTCLVGPGARSCGKADSVRRAIGRS
jgi:hypothetical protein